LCIKGLVDQKIDPQDKTAWITTAINLIARLSGDLPELRQNLSMLIAVASAADVLGHLGTSLVRSLRLVDARQDAKELASWREAWLELGAGQAELEIPLRIFRVGIEYLIRRDEKVLLDLVSVERKVVRQALGLGGEDGVEPHPGRLHCAKYPRAPRGGH
jgi:hypothetical protein